MAEATPSRSSSIANRTDYARERELFRYYKPPEPCGGRSLSVIAQNTLNVDVATSPDSTLTALAQLCALRLDASRAMISVIGKEMQYFIAESTKTLNLLDSQKSEVDGDGLWIGCSQVRKEGRLCEKTVELSPIEGKFPCFIVTDLSKDYRFNQLPFVIGPPFFRFYAGTPLTTKRGINIGSLFIIDPAVRPNLSVDQEEFLGSIAQVIVTHMEVGREAEERKKATKMSRGLNAFVEGKNYLCAEDSILDGWSFGQRAAAQVGKSQFKEFPNSRSRQISTERLRAGEKMRSHHVDTDTVKGSLDSGTNNVPSLFTRAIQPPDLPTQTTLSSDQDTSQDEPDSRSVLDNKDTGHSQTFLRAAKLLRESLDLQIGGGTVFLDAAVGFHGLDQDISGNITSWDGAIDKNNVVSCDLRSQNRRSSSTITNARTYRHSMQSIDFETSKKLYRAAEIISFSVDELIPNTQDQSQGLASFTPLGEEQLQILLKRYPHGKLWSFDEDGGLSSEEEELSPKNANGSSNSKQLGCTRELDAKMLQTHFPSARQLLFAPLWDSGASRWFSGCFAFTTSSLRIFSVETELTFLRAFNNSVMAEVSRLASIAADRQKADFIGSISHELRSPLHGVLASAEFLSETESDAFQDSLINTISSCGRTLLDTINHVLDFSKINMFERNWRSARKADKTRKRTHVNPTTNQDAPAMMNIYAIIDLAAITEEVIEGVYFGQLFHDISSPDFMESSSRSGDKTPIRKYSNSEANVPSNIKSEVSIILDFAYEDFTFSTQPGALRRVIMNVFGNALKYTTEGTIKVKLSLHDVENMVEKQAGAKIFEIRVVDTGKGISSEYLRTKLYTPFCQEDVLASGTGLGLSIVRSIITMLNGSIDIRSQVGQGTEVIVRIPMMRASGIDSMPSTPSLDDIGGPSLGRSIRALRTEYSKRRVLFYRPGGDSGSIGHLTETHRVLDHYIYNWFGLEVVSSLSSNKHVDVIIIDEKDLSRVIEIPIVFSSILLLGGNLSRYSGRRPSPINDSHHVEFVSKPLGPYKLAKALHLCFKHAANTDSRTDPMDAPYEEALSSLNAPTENLNFERLNLDGLNGDTSVTIWVNEVLSASNTLNARMAVDTLSSNDTECGVQANQISEFPFPGHENTKPGSNFNSQDELNMERPKFNKRITEPSALCLPLDAYLSGEKKNANTDLEDPLLQKQFTPKATNPSVKNLSPRLLLVDDNNINLRLLETFMRKRKYNLVDSAVNGELAVKAAESHQEGYDIIFMDISMPIMNGFEATRRIREMEHVRERAPALIIALTGLASSKDQVEAFTSGVDLFMTKPVSFKEVGRLLDNWETKGGLDDLTNVDDD